MAFFCSSVLVSCLSLLARRYPTLGMSLPLLADIVRDPSWRSLRGKEKMGGRPAGIALAWPSLQRVPPTSSIPIWAGPDSTFSDLRNLRGGDVLGVPRCERMLTPPDDDLSAIEKTSKTRRQAFFAVTV